MRIITGYELCSFSSLKMMNVFEPLLTHRCLRHEDGMQAGFRLEVHLVGMIQYGLETVPVLNWKPENMDGSIGIKLLIHF